MAKKISKSNANEKYFKYFNKRPVKKTSELTFETLRTAAKAIVTDFQIDYDALEWGTVREMQEPLSKAWDYQMTQSGYEFYFRRWWLDQLVAELGHMIWNLVWRSVRKNGDDRVADRVASEAEEKFLKGFF
jgi:hypothetical protein